MTEAMLLLPARMKTLVIILLVLVVLLYFKWILMTLLLPFMAIDCRNQKHSRPLKILCLPYVIVTRITSGGYLRYAIYQIGLIPSIRVRTFIYRCLGAHIAKKAVVHFRTEIRAPWNLTIGRGSIIGDNVLLDARHGIVIGRNVNFSSNASVYTLQHDHRDPDFGCYENQPDKKLSVEIDDRAWIGSNVVVLPGVHIGEGAVCCAGCVVTKDVEPFAIVAGVPAKKIGERNRNLRYEFSGSSVSLY